MLYRNKSAKPGLSGQRKEPPMPDLSHEEMRHLLLIVQDAWERHVPQFPAPNEGHMKSVLRRADLQLVLQAVESVSRAAAKGRFKNAAHAHNSTSTRLNGLMEREREGAFRLDDNWQPFPPAPETPDAWVPFGTKRLRSEDAA